MFRRTEQPGYRRGNVELIEASLCRYSLYATARAIDVFTGAERHIDCSGETDMPLFTILKFIKYSAEEAKMMVLQRTAEHVKALQLEIDETNARFVRFLDIINAADQQTPTV
jgi:hypothetical protein